MIEKLKIVIYALEELILKLQVMAHEPDKREISLIRIEKTKKILNSYKAELKALEAINNLPNKITNWSNL